MPDTVEFKKALSEGEARGEFFRQMHRAGQEVEELRELCATQQLQLKKLDGQIAILRNERNRAHTEANSVLKSRNAPLMVSSDEEWLFRRNVTWKFKQRADGSRICVLRVRGRKILRVRGEVSPDSPTTDIIRYLMEKARTRESGRRTVADFNGDSAKRRRRRKAEASVETRSSTEQQEVPEGSEAGGGAPAKPQSDPQTS